MQSPIPCDNGPFVALDDARPGQERLTLFSGFQGVIRADRPDEVGPALEALNGGRARGEHLAGYFSYELGYALEPKLLPLLPGKRDLPLLWFGRFTETRHLKGAEIGAWLGEQARGRAYRGPLKLSLARDDYETRFTRAEGYIRAGDIYQVNLTFPARFAFAGDPISLYRELREGSAAGFGGIIQDGERDLLSFSPELFFEIENGILSARPMKGTAPRGADAMADDELRAQLRMSEKDRAENLMIVDLIRNDLSRVARMGSVRVEDLFAVETYPTVHQMVSTVRCDLRAEAQPSDIVKALFPCGSVTGAPKIRAMEIVRELEETPRGLYCGAMGAFFADGSARFNVAIRTLTLSGNKGTLGIGSGIVADSQGPSEYEECTVKARFFTESRRPIGLIETLQYDPASGFVREDLHLARLERSAKTLGLTIDPAHARAVLRADVRSAQTPQRVRLHVGENGEISIAAQELQPNPPHWTYAISNMRLPSGDALSRHKIDWRETYDGEYARLHALTGCDEVLFLNDKGELAEGSRSNLFVRFGDILATPPLSAGILDGCLRRALLDDSASQCSEQILTPADLARACAVFFGNSLRGLIPAIPVTDPPVAP